MCEIPRAIASTLVLALLLVSPLRGQGILNVERLQSGLRLGFHGAASASGSYSGGNSDVLQLDATLGAAYRGARHWPRIFAGGELLRSDNGRIVDNRFVHARYGYLLSRRVRSFHFVQVQSNDNLLVEWRVLVGSGIRGEIRLFESLTLELGTGPMFERERLDADRVSAGVRVETSVMRLATVGVFRWEIGDDATLLNVLYHQPVADDPSDYRVLDDLTMSMRVASGLTVDLTMGWRHDSRPPSELNPDDLRLRVGMSFGWGGS
jgi:hypothetical protein